MWLVFFISLLCVFLTYLQDTGNLKRGMLLGFIMMTSILSIRYGYGNDFFNYLDIFNASKAYDWDQLAIMAKWVEIGWLVLCKLFAPLGFQWLIAFHTLFLFCTFYYLINKYVPKGWKWLAVFFVLFNSGILIIYISMLRQSLAICFFLLAVDGALDKKLIKMAVCCALAYVMHHSALIIIPFVLFAYFQSGWLNTVAVFSGVAFMIAATINDSLASLMLNTALSSVEILEEEYEHYGDAGSRGSGLGVLLELMMFVPALFDYKKYSTKERIVFILFLMNMIVFPLQYVVLMFGRIRYYFVVFGFLFLPFALKKCSRMEVKYFALGITIFITLWNYIQFFGDRTFQKAYSVYHICF